MAFHRDDEVRIHLEDLLERGGVRLQNRLIFRPDIALVVLEMNILNLVCQDILHGLRGAEVALVGWRRRGNGHGSVRFGCAACSGAVKWYVVVVVG